MDYSKEYVSKISDFLNEPIRVRKISYKGKGRPTKNDYAIIPRKQLDDFRAFQIFQAGFTTK